MFRGKMMRELIQLALRRVKEGSGSYHAGPKQDWAQHVPPLREWMGDIPFVIIGGLATRLYMAERMTLDVDILVHQEDREQAAQRLTAAGASRTAALAIDGEVWALQGGLVLDLIVGRQPWLSEAMTSARTGPDGQPYIDLPWLVLLKLEASRSQDLADITRMLGAASALVRDQVRRVVKQWRPQDVEDVDSMIQLGELEYP